jgi:acyl-CoA thioesterase
MLTAAPFEKLLGMETLVRANGHAKLTLVHQPQLNNPFGIMHGGAIVSLADSALAAAIYSLYPKRKFYTVKLDVNFKSPARGGALLAEAQVREQRRKIIFCDARILDEADTLVAEATAKFYLENEPAAAGSGTKVS